MFFLSRGIFCHLIDILYILMLSFTTHQMLFSVLFLLLSRQMFSLSRGIFYYVMYLLCCCLTSLWGGYLAACMLLLFSDVFVLSISYILPYVFLLHSYIVFAVLLVETTRYVAEQCGSMCLVYDSVPIFCVSPHLVTWLLCPASASRAILLSRSALPSKLCTFLALGQ